MTTSTPSMRRFFVVWFGQLVSVTGSSVTGFGLAIWVFTETGSVTNLALVTLALSAPAVIVSPFAGALVDRWDRRAVMLIADAAAGLATAIIAVLFFTDALELWHIYLLIGVGSLANAFQAPAWMAAVPLLVPKEQLGRANGLVQLNDGLSIVLAPGIAGALLVSVGLGGVIALDMITFVIAVFSLISVRFPPHEQHEETTTGSVRGDVVAGWRWLRERPGLFGLLWVYGGVNFALAFGNVLYIPLIVAFASEAAAGGVLTFAGFGAVIGSLVMSALGAPEKKVRATMASIVFVGLAVAASGLAESLVLIAITAFLILGAVPIANTASQVLWQVKVPLGVQGRVFAVRRTIAQAIAPIAIILAGPLADNIFEPMMAEDGALSGSVGAIIGTGDGRGIGLMFILTGILTVILGIVGYLAPRVRNLETELPDHLPDTVAEDEPETPTLQA